MNVKEHCIYSDESLGHVKKGLYSVLGEVIISVSLELMRLEYSVECWTPSTRKTEWSKLSRGPLCYLGPGACDV